MKTIITGESGEIGRYLLSRFSASGVDHPSRLIHLAGKLPAKAKDSSEELIEANLNYLLKTIKSAEEAGLEEFVFFSTNSIYRGQDKLSLTEEAVPVIPDIYTLTKYLGEEILRKSRIKKVLCVRIGGLLEVIKATNFLSQTLQKLMQQQPVTITNFNCIYNNFVSREEIFQFLSSLKLSESFDVVHLGAEPEMTLKEIIELMKRQARSDSCVHLSDEKTPIFNLDIEKAKKYGFRPEPPQKSIEKWVEEVTRLKR